MKEGMRLALFLSMPVLGGSYMLVMKGYPIGWLGIVLAVGTILTSVHMLSDQVQCPECGYRGTINEMSEEWWENPPQPEEEV